MKNQDVFSEVNRMARTFLDQIAIWLPQNFSPQLKNPCWEPKIPGTKIYNLEGNLANKFEKDLQHSNYPEKKFAKKKLVVCLPFFFLAGFPNSGTSTVHDMLSLHPNIEAPSAKEPQWWTRGTGLQHDGELRRENVIHSFLFYTQSFKSIALKMAESQHENLITYDGSQSTLWDSNFYVNEQDYCATPAVLSHVLPNAKFIVVMRNPATRLYSNFIYSCSNKYSRYINHWPHKIRQDSAKLFHNKIERLVEQFNNCTRTASVFECTNLRTKKLPQEDIGGCNIKRQRLTIGMYVVHLKKWLQFFPIKNFLFIRTEDLSKHPEDIILSITNFLGIESGPGAMSEILKLHKNAHPSGVQPMNPSTMDLLEKFYQPYNEELAHLLNDNSFLWKD